MGEERRKEKRKQEVILALCLDSCSVFGRKSKGGLCSFFSQLLQPPLAVYLSEKSRGNSGKISGSREERLRVISGAKIKPKSKLWCLEGGHGFGWLGQ